MAQPQSSVVDPSDPASLPSDVVYDALADTRRRYTLHYLKQRDEPVTVRELSEQVAAWENNKHIAELTHQERKRVYIALHQSHLDTLTKQGLIEYDEDEGTVKSSTAFDGVEIYLEVVPRNSVPWSRFYLGLSLANAIILGLAWTAVPPFEALPDHLVGAIPLITFGVSALVQTITSRRMRFGDPRPPPEVTTR